MTATKTDKKNQQTESNQKIRIKICAYDNKII